MQKNEMHNQLKNVRILYVQEDHQKRLRTTKILRKFSSKVHVCIDFKDIFKDVSRFLPEMLISDIGLGGSLELDALQKIRKEYEEIFIIIASAHEQVEYLQKAIELEVSSYLLEPVSMKEFEKAFMHVMQKCCKQKDLKSIYLSDDLFYQASLKALIYDGSKLNLNKKEARLLEYFIEYKNMLLTYAQIQKHIWPGLNVSSASLRTLVKNLRKKGMSNLIQNISGLGYTLQIS
ncbi:response regulator transcription factor [Sulfurimonas sp. MAG313]|nr:response regulator [Sulfurimonas sp. MAG313]MDF1882080.1 response regulator transcription factor [Sulfurimonas sp. MAG313]